jgi:hypothetical protein
MGIYEQEQNYLAAERSLSICDLMSHQPTPRLPKFTRRIPKFTFSVQSEYAVVGVDGEFADMGNPRGEIVRERFFMVAADSTGRCFRYGWEETPRKAELVFQYVAPAVSEWPLWRYEYGSKAYQEEGAELD